MKRVFVYLSVFAVAVMGIYGSLQLPVRSSDPVECTVVQKDEDTKTIWVWTPDNEYEGFVVDDETYLGVQLGGKVLLTEKGNLYGRLLSSDMQIQRAP